MDWERVRQQRQARRHGTEEAEPKQKRTPGPQTHIKREPVKRWADMSPSEREAVRRSLGVGKGGKHRPSPP